MVVDEFMVCMDKIITSAGSFQESTPPPSANGGVSACENGDTSVNNCRISDAEGEGCSFSCVEAKGLSLRECRICQEEDEERDMEAPCACNGTLKFAHRKCIQRWCNKKGDITCEICNQAFSPNYSSPPPRSNVDVMAIDIRQAWGPHIDLRDPHFLAFTEAERQFLQSGYDEYTFATSGIVTCIRTVALILMLLLMIRQTLMLTRDLGMLRESSVFFNYQVSILQLAGFVLPCYVVARSYYIVQCRRRRQG